MRVSGAVSDVSGEPKGLDASVMGDVYTSFGDLAMILFGALLVWALLRATRFAIDVVPLAPTRREQLRRAHPLLSGASAVFYMLLAAAFFFDKYPTHFPIAVAVILGVSIAASWFALRDVVSGIFLKAGRVCRVGDYVRIGDVQGRVERMGQRVLVVETARGEEAIIPYSRVARAELLRTPVSERGTLHVFELTLPAAPPVAETKRLIRESALACHWSAIAREPEIAVLDADRFEVTIFALDPDHVRDVEASVRRAVGASRSSKAQPTGAGGASTGGAASGSR
ncbi:MAG: mechanosensitive ion channel [Sandaracinaceae bacterium]|nr:MAG: mechanosensitive ion channel [Sandaracinaceae bacterium]